MIVAATAGLISLLLSALLASILMVAFGILSQQEARDAINWDVYVTIASAFGLGSAMENSGVSSAMANFLVNVGNSIGSGSAGLLGAVYLATFLISNIVTNNAAAALIYPVAMEAAILTGTDQVIMAYCIMLAASASFMSPFGYTTNLLIYGPGGYKFKDFLIFGTPMQLILWIFTTALLSVSFGGWWLSWVVTGILFIAVAAIMIVSCSCKSKSTVKTS
jgi:di/tricarboxylate transporter